MKISAKFKFVDRLIEKRQKRIATNVENGMAYILSLIRGRAQMYLTGPYPYRLSFRFGKGNLWKQLDTRTEIAGDVVIGKILIGQLAWYAKVWESVGEFAGRKGKIFKNGHPMTRQFVRPAMEDLRQRILITLKERACVKG